MAADGTAVGREQHPVGEKRMSPAQKHVAAQHVVAHAAAHKRHPVPLRSDQPFSSTALTNGMRRHSLGGAACRPRMPLQAGEMSTGRREEPAGGVGRSRGRSEHGWCGVEPSSAMAQTAQAAAAAAPVSHSPALTRRRQAVRGAAVPPLLCRAAPKGRERWKVTSKVVRARARKQSGVSACSTGRACW